MRVMAMPVVQLSASLVYIGRTKSATGFSKPIQQQPLNQARRSMNASCLKLANALTACCTRQVNRSILQRGNLRNFDASR